MAGLPLILTPPVGVVGCDLEIAAAVGIRLHLRNRKKLSNFIYANVNPHTTYLDYHVENLPKDGLGCRGRWLVRLAWDYFRQQGHVIGAIRGEWISGDNLQTVNQLTLGNRLSLEQAASQTWAADRAREYGFRTVAILAFAGGAGNYQSVDALFTP